LQESFLGGGVRMRISSLILSVLFIYYPDFLMNHPISVESDLHLWECNLLLGLKRVIRNGYQVFLESGTILAYGTYSTQMAGKVPSIYHFPNILSQKIAP